ncbi:MAG: aminotransferase class V-fold PLP-dependent enzyme, partial [Proteobacteria bacterium]|nr:aminotransferase class V-fold PLP-dependent enzyme [Pseudomonadota bacterium]
MQLVESSLKSLSTSMFNIEHIRTDFPILKLKIDGNPLVYLDNAASSQMPKPVIDRMVRYQTTQHANINRAV